MAPTSHRSPEYVRSCNYFHNILRLFDVLPNFPKVLPQVNNAGLLLINTVYTSRRTSCRTI